MPVSSKSYSERRPKGVEELKAQFYELADKDDAEVEGKL
jgi:hypothetical protein